MIPGSSDLYREDPRKLRQRRDFSGNYINEVFFHQFKRSAEALGVTVLRADNQAGAADLLNQQIVACRVTEIAAVPLTLLGDHVTTVGRFAVAAGVEFSMCPDRHQIERADMGISQFDMAVAQVGAVFQDASGLGDRLVSMLPPLHVVLLHTAALVNRLEDALQRIMDVYEGVLPPYLSFISGPSKTADIERQLTVGVHGPAKLIVLFIDHIGDVGDVGE